MSRRATLIACVVGALAAALPASASAGEILGAGATLSAGQSIVSPSGEYELLMQSDGNLVEYVTGGRSIWSSQTSGQPGAHAIMQSNGDLVVVDAAGQSVWSSNSHTSGCASELAMQDDGNLVIYGPDDSAIWDTGIPDSLADGDVLKPGWSRYSARDNVELIMQTDGNLVLYGAGGARWNTKTAGHPGAYATLQSDGNLVVYAPSGSALWNSVTEGHRGDSAIVQEDGNFVVYSPSQQPLWNAGTSAGQTLPGYVGPSKPAAGSCPPPPAPAPAPTPVAPVPVTSAPVTTTVPTPAPASSGPRPLRIRLAISWTWNRSMTRLRRVSLGSAPGPTRLALSCRGRGCPRHRGTARAAGLRRLRRLLARLTGHRYRAGQELLVTLTAPGYAPERVAIHFRWGRVPRIQLLRR
jgi:hypothetical protein